DKSKPFWSIVLYVIDYAKANKFAFAVFDALQMKDVRINPNGIVTVMGADQGFTVNAEKNGNINWVTA
ncbi:hypothetical protein PMAYCL1PPCAC_01417, partial [Pristionchus mayeri]